MSAKKEVEKAIDYLNIFENQDNLDVISEWAEKKEDKNEIFEEVKEEKKRDTDNYNKKMKHKKETTREDIEKLEPVKVPEKKDKKQNKPKEEPKPKKAAPSRSFNTKDMPKGKAMTMDEAKALSRKRGVELIVAIPANKLRPVEETVQDGPDKIVLIDRETGEVFPVNSDTCIIGKSSDCTISLDDRFISRKHAKLTKKNGAFYIEDLASTNGTYIDGKKLTPHTPTRLDVDVLLKIADMFFSIKEG